MGKAEMRGYLRQRAAWHGQVSQVHAVCGERKLAVCQCIERAEDMGETKTSQLLVIMPIVNAPLTFAGCCRAAASILPPVADDDDALTAQ